MSPVHILCYCSTTVPNRFAHPIQILKTVRALAEQPGVRVTVYFVTLGAKPRSIWRYYGMKPMPNVQFRAMVPRWYFRWTGMNNYVSVEQYRIYRLVRWRLARDLRRFAASSPVIMYTRNENVVSLLREAADSVGAPIYLELHWLKYLDRYRKHNWGSPGDGDAPALCDRKELVRRLKAAEREAISRADGILCLTGEIQRILSRWNLDCPVTTLPSGVDPIPPELLRTNGRATSAAELEGDDAEIPGEADSGGAEDGSEEDTGEVKGRSSAAADPDAPALHHDILYLGQLYPWKGVDLLVRAMVHLPEYRLTVVGGNRERDKNRIKGIIRELDLADRIRIVGHVSHPKVSRYIRKSRVCVIPLLRAGYREARFFTSPLKLFEFAAWGKVIVASDLPTLREVLEHRKNALLVRPDDPVALAAGLREALEDSELRKRLAAGALELADHYAYSNRAQRILAFCRPGGKLVA